VIIQPLNMKCTANINDNILNLKAIL
jgi:hypothetical protein